MRVETDAGEVIELGATETAPTTGIIDYSRRVTDDFGVTTVVKRGFARRMSVRLAVPFNEVGALQRRLADLRATAAMWVADEQFAWLAFRGFYKSFEIDHAVPPLSYCTLEVEGLAETEPGGDPGGDPAPEGRTSTLQLLQPATLTSDLLISSSVAEDDYPEWSAGTAYSAGVRIIKAATHRIYESTAASLGADPAGTSGKWIDVGPTNRWAMFDQALGSVTSASGLIEVTFAVAVIEAVALLDVVGTTVRLQASNYDRTLPVGAGAVTFLDLPPTTGHVTVTISGTGEVSVGTLLHGRLVALGLTEAAPTAGITDYSRKAVDDFGEVTVVPRAWAKRMTTRALIRTDAVDTVANRIAAVRAQPSLWIGSEGLDSLTVYGFFKDFSIEVGEGVSKLSLSIEGLSNAAKIEPLFTQGPPGAPGASAFTLVPAGTLAGAALVTPTSVSYPGSGPDWGAGAYTQEAFTGGVYVSARSVDPSRAAFLMLGPVPNTDPSNPYSIYLRSDGRYDVRLGSGDVNGGAGFGSYTAEDLFSIVYDNTVVSFLKNGAPFYAIGAGSELTLRANFALAPLAGLASIAFGPAGRRGTDGSPGANGAPGAGQFSLISTSFTHFPQPNVIEKDANGGSSFGTGSAKSAQGWTGGAAMSWRVTHNAVFGGLSVAPDAGGDFYRITYALHPSSDGNLYAVTNGSFAVVGGGYAIGDVLSVRYDGIGTVEYLRNGAIVATASAVAALRLFLDCQIAVPGARLTDVTFAPLGAPGANGQRGASAIGYVQDDTPPNGEFFSQTWYRPSFKQWFRWTGGAWSQILGALATMDLIADSAFIGNAVILKANIGDLQVDKFKIAGRAVEIDKMLREDLSSRGRDADGTDYFMTNPGLMNMDNFNIYLTGDCATPSTVELYVHAINASLIAVSNKPQDDSFWRFYIITPNGAVYFFPMPNTGGTFVRCTLPAGQGSGTIVIGGHVITGSTDYTEPGEPGQPVDHYKSYRARVQYIDVEALWRFI